MAGQDETSSFKATKPIPTMQVNIRNEDEDSIKVEETLNIGQTSLMTDDNSEYSDMSTLPSENPDKSDGKVEAQKDEEVMSMETGKG